MRHPKSQLCPNQSVEGGEKWGRYSFVGFDPRAVIRLRGEEVIIVNQSGVIDRIPHRGDPLGVLRRYLQGFTLPPVAGLPRFFAKLRPGRLNRASVP